MGENQSGARVVTIKGILNLMLRAWIPVLVLMLVCGLGMGIFKVGKQKAKVAAQGNAAGTQSKVKIDEKGFLNVKGVTDIEDILAEKQRYLDESLLMRIDPMHKWNGNLRYSFTFRRETELAESEEGMTDADRAAFEVSRQRLANAYAAAFREQEVYDKIMERAGLGAETSYLNEIMGAEATSVPGTFYVWGYGADREQMKALLDAVESAVGDMKSTGLEIAGAYTVSVERADPYELVDTALADTQAAKQADVTNQQTAIAGRMAQLTDEELAYLEAYKTAREEPDYVDGMTITVTREAKGVSDNYPKVFLTNAAKGLGIGLAVSFVMAFFLFLFSPVVISSQSICDMYDLPVFADASLKKGADEQVGLMKEVILRNMKKGSVALVTSDSKLFETRGSSELKATLHQAGAEPVMAAQIFTDREALSLLQDTACVYLVEKVGRSRHRKIERELLFIREMGIRVGGVFLV